ncbi:MAG TPA: hypothetical protein VF624_04425 [Tepidisphaeraceae bacterium]|jgi:hypothetical protein
MMLRRLLIVAATVTCVNAVVEAQAPASLGDGPATRDAERSGDRPRASSPYWNGGSSDAGSDLPATDIRAVAPARAAAVASRWTYNQLLVDLGRATRMLSQEFEGREDFRRALADEKSAYDAMAEARRRVLEPLGRNDAYIAAESLRMNLTEQIKDAHDRPKPDFQQIDAMAKLKLSYVAENRKLEQDALERDADYQSARGRYLTAATAVQQQRQSVALMIAKDDELRQLRRQVAESRINKLASAAYLSSTIRARDISLDYASFYRRSGYLNNNYGGYVNGFQPFGYGSGYGYGGGVRY